MATPCRAKPRGAYLVRIASYTPYTWSRKDLSGLLVPESGVGTLHHVILQSKHGSIDDSRMIIRRMVTT